MIEGIYIFGGRDEKGPKNRLYIYRVGTKQNQWEEPRCEGQAPLARYGHSMNYYPDKNIIIIFGGRNDDNYVNTGQSYLNDVWILSLDELVWQQWDKEERGSVPIARYSHCSAVLGNSIIIFGGLSEENYCKTDIYSLDMEPVISIKRNEKNSLTQSKTEFSSPEKSEIKHNAIIHEEEYYPYTQDIPGDQTKNNQSEEPSPLIPEDIIQENY